MSRFQRHNQFARTLGVTPPYLTKLRDQGRAVRDDGTGKYDLHHEVNAMLVETAAATKAPETPAEDASDPSIRDLQRAKLVAEVGRVEAARDKIDLQNAASRRELVPVSMVIAMAGSFASGSREYLLGLPKRLASRLVAMVRSGGDEIGVRDLLEEEVGDSIARALDMGQRAADQLLDDWPMASDDDEGDDDDA